MFVLRKIEPLEDAQTERVAVEARQEQDSLNVLLKERGQFVRRLQIYEQQLEEAKSALVEVRQRARWLKQQRGEAESALAEERRRTRRLRKRIQGLNQQTHDVQGSRIRRLLEKLSRKQLKDRRNDE